MFRIHPQNCILPPHLPGCIYQVSLPQALPPLVSAPQLARNPNLPAEAGPQIKFAEGPGLASWLFKGGGVDGWHLGQPSDLGRPLVLHMAV